MARRQGPIAAALQQSGLQADCPFRPAAGGGAAEQLTPEGVESVDAAAFAEYAGRLNQYLQVRPRRRTPVTVEPAQGWPCEAVPPVFSLHFTRRALARRSNSASASRQSRTP